MSDQLQRFQYNVDVKQGVQIYGLSGKTLYEGTFSRDSAKVLIVEMNETIARHEGYFYRTLNNHPHVIRTFGYIENPRNLTVYVQEFAHYGDLANLLYNEPRNFTEAVRIEMFRQVADAMSYLASKSVVHGDLGCRNILVYKIDSNNVSQTLVKITDFGLARSRTNPSCVTANPSVIPIRFCAPEILQNNVHESYSEKSDVYSMGVTMWEALSQNAMPYGSISDDKEVRRLKLQGTLLPRPAACNQALWKLIEKCWPMNPNDRITFNQMKDRLAEINRDQTLPTPVREVSARMFDIRQFRLGADLQIKGRYSQEQSVYEMNWISQHEYPPSILVRLDKEPPEHEFLFYDQTLKHENLVKIFGSVRYDALIFMMVQEQPAHGNLRHVLVEKNFRPTNRVLVELFMQIINVMIYLTENKLVHGDLRCENILVFQMDPNDPTKNLLKLTDFQSVQQISDEPTVIKRRSNISVRHCAPEILRTAGHGSYSEFSDVYSLGVLMWEVCSGGTLAFHNCVLDGEVRQRKLNGEKLPQPVNCHPKIWEIMGYCWFNEPLCRFNFTGLKTLLGTVQLNPPAVAAATAQNFRYRLNVDIQRRERFSGRLGKTFYAAKWVRPQQPQDICLLAMDEKTARQELEFYLEFHSHPHIIQTLGLIECDDQLINVVQERSRYGDLQSFLLRGQQTFDDQTNIEIFLQIVDAMSELTRKKIIHGDLRCANILICQMNPNQPREILVKLTNFHQAFQLDAPPTFTQRNLTDFLEHYGAIELLSNTSSATYSEYSEVYSMGILMWQVYSRGALPFGATDRREKAQARRLKDEQLPKPDNCPGQIWETINNCFFKTPSLRIEFKNMETRLKQIKSQFSSATAAQTRTGRSNVSAPMDSSRQIPVQAANVPPTPPRTQRAGGIWWQMLFGGRSD